MRLFAFNNKVAWIGFYKERWSDSLVPNLFLSLDTVYASFQYERPESDVTRGIRCLAMALYRVARTGDG